jgi:ParB family chromosome partitioning protein
MKNKRVRVLSATSKKDEANVSAVNKKNRLLYNSGNFEWYTPSEYIEATREVMGSIDIDPASTALANETVKAKTFYTKETDGLTKEWKGNVWMNPPYKHALIVQFISVLLAKLKSEETKQAIVLVNNATETKWFQALLEICNAICLPKKRIRFIDPSGRRNDGPLQGQAVLYFGARVVEFRRIFATFGPILCKRVRIQIS